MSSAERHALRGSVVSGEQKNDFVNQLRDEVRDWRAEGYPGTALVTRRLLEWWFERDEERKAMGKRFFFCQQEAIETVIYLYEVQNRRKMPETGDLLRYALKLATGTGKTVVMAMLVTWSTLHKRKVSGSSLSNKLPRPRAEPHCARPGERRILAATGSTRPASTTSTRNSTWCRRSTLRNSSRT